MTFAPQRRQIIILININLGVISITDDISILKLITSIFFDKKWSFINNTSSALFFGLVNSTNRFMDILEKLHW
jgi:hypothetical protein